MPETSPNFFVSQGGQGGASNRGTDRGASFLQICILGIFGDISSNFSWDRCQRRKSDLSFNSTSQPTLLFKIHFKSYQSKKHTYLLCSFITKLQERAKSNDTYTSLCSYVVLTTKLLSNLYFARTDGYGIPASFWWESRREFQWEFPLENSFPQIHLICQIGIGQSNRFWKSISFLSFNSTTRPTLLIKIHFKSSK